MSVLLLIVDGHETNHFIIKKTLSEPNNLLKIIAELLVIGLVTVKQISLEHGGKISAICELGKGLVFSTELSIGNLEAEE